MSHRKLTVLVGLILGILVSGYGALAAPTLNITPTIFPTPIPNFTPYIMPTQPTVYPVTATISGPALGSDRAYVRSLMARVPPQLGGFDTAVVDQGFDGVAYLVVTVQKDIYLNITLEFYSKGSAVNGYRDDAARMTNGQVTLIADGAQVDAQNDDKVAIMFYRNVQVRVDPPWSFLGGQPRPATIPFTNDQLIAILKDLYEKVLKNAP